MDIFWNYTMNRKGIYIQHHTQQLGHTLCTVSHVDQRSVAHVKQTQGRKVLPVSGHEVRGLAKVLACWSGQCEMSN